MLKISRTEKKFRRLDTPRLADASILERADLQEYIANSPEEFFAELGEPLFILAKEVQPSDAVQDRVDLLAVDKQGRVAVIELKRGSHKLQMLQAIAYAGMISKWSSDEIILLPGIRMDDLTDFLEVETDEINRTQRLILIAEDFDFEILAGAEWLYEQFQVDVLCAKVALAVDRTANAEYLVCNRIFPAKELADEAIARRRPSTQGGNSWTDWEQALVGVENPALVEFVKSELQAGQENRLRTRTLYYRVAGHRRFHFNVTGARARVAQLARFPDDAQYWSERLADKDIREKAGNHQLGFFITTSDDLCAFKAALAELESVSWGSSTKGATA